jgi:hypothetical protein
MASEYNLIVNFTEEDLKYIEGTGKQVVLVKESDTSNHSMLEQAGQSFVEDVAWVTFSPWMTTKVTWQSSYAVYASDVEKMNGAIIEKMSSKQAEPRTRMYNFVSGGYFKDEDYNEGPQDMAYYITNISGEKETFGLAQSVKVRSTEYSLNPINAVTMLNNDIGYFIPVEKVKIFLTANASNGKVISVVQSDTFTVDLTKKGTQTVIYDRASGKFRIEEKKPEAV